MKSKLTLIVIGTILALANTTISVGAYEAHEHPFFQDELIKGMPEDAADRYCRNKYEQLKATGDLGGGFNTLFVNHVWANVGYGECVANSTF